MNDYFNIQKLHSCCASREFLELLTLAYRRGITLAKPYHHYMIEAQARARIAQASENLA